MLDVSSVLLKKLAVAQLVMTYRVLYWTSRYTIIRKSVALCNTYIPPTYETLNNVRDNFLTPLSASKSRNLRKVMCHVMSTPSIIANFRHTWLYKFAVRAIGENWNCDSGDSGSKKCKWLYDGSYSGVWRKLSLEGVWSQVVGFVLCV
jgi:hypothetical protein